MIIQCEELWRNHSRLPGRVALKAELDLGESRAKILARYFKEINGANVSSRERDQGRAEAKPDEKFQVSGGEKEMNVLSISSRVKTVEDAIARAEIDTDIWQVKDFQVTSWEVAGKFGKASQYNERFETEPLWRVAVKFERKPSDVVALEHLIQKIKDGSPVVAPVSYPAQRNGRPRRALEVTIMDPHLGMTCYQPASDLSWSLEQCEGMFMWAIDEILEDAEKYGPFEQILFPIGNDFLHADGLFHKTTSGTDQPEMEAWHHVFVRGEELLISAINRLREVAPVHLLQIPGNHDRATSFSMGRVMNAWFRNDPGVTVDASASPYKFWRFGENLVGFEHGHSVAQIRLAALMANECKDLWAKTSFREWHLGDQHRKGSSKPSAMEEQGVSVEYLVGLTPPNEWHRLKGFNWQKRGATGFIWNHDMGLEARIQKNINSYTGLPTGAVA